MAQFNGKAIYQPQGKAAEYSKWACNFYIGCSNGCEYCYLKHGRGAAVLGGDRPTLKKCFKDELHAWEVFMKEVSVNIKELQQHGLFFSFTTDPLLEDTKALTFDAMGFCLIHKIPVKLLTKCTDWVESFDFEYFIGAEKDIAFGFTLTDHDDLEPGASTNQERIEVMKRLHDAGFKTFASIEPIIDFPSAKNMIKATIGFCDLYKIGLMSGKKYDVCEAQSFVEWLNELECVKIYLKKSIQKLTRYTNDELDEWFVGMDYNIFI